MFDEKQIVGLDEELIAILRSNPVLWKAIEDRRRQILALPNRRPVLR